MNNEEIVVPLIVFSSIVILVGLVLTYQLKKKQSFLRFLDQQNDMKPESIQAVGRLFFSARNDLRKGVFLIVTAFAIWGFSAFADFRGGNLDLNDALNGIAFFPMFAGLAYLLLFYFSRK